MIPFLHVGPITLPTFGLMMATAMLCAFFVLRADLKRRGLAREKSGLDAETMTALPSLAGFVGAKLYHVLESPQELFADPVGQIFTSFGFAWFGGLMAGLATFIWLARRHKIPVLELCDAASPAAAVGYGVGRIGCLLSGDGDYGIPTSLPWGMSFPNGLVPTTARVHPTPIYEFLIALLIARILWRMGARQISTIKIAGAGLPAQAGFPRLRSGQVKPAATKEQPAAQRKLFSVPGTLFADYLILTGVARFLIEFIRINPRSFFGLTNAQAASLASIALGMAVLVWARRRDAPPRG